MFGLSVQDCCGFFRWFYTSKSKIVIILSYCILLIIPMSPSRSPTCLRRLTFKMWNQRLGFWASSEVLCSVLESRLQRAAVKSTKSKRRATYTRHRGEKVTSVFFHVMSAKFHLVRVSADSVPQRINRGSGPTPPRSLRGNIVLSRTCGIHQVDEMHN